MITEEGVLVLFFLVLHNLKKNSSYITIGCKFLDICLIYTFALVGTSYKQKFGVS